ncbi:AbrB/MazE/SpoVT family DNA-binding domain-containing protein [Mariprofundus erugo]|uniref:AbrB/MazE/SpoVT family DNA-binding domain-containing protein n=1 Tax=Mariprofundus erugo TaxID=2528639 RepID=UPI0010FE2E6B|nr:AbrB/MazE/SpoVT family DNA-binding domain-containing protein [Mariprofundus erugo]TLS78417.1 AbrB/MazE/SpoVT family DNA-binding domain-containing protein [Mariprofundus erugo]
MGTARLSSKGQLIIPKHVREAHCWDAGQELEVIDMPEGVLLKAKKIFPATSIADLEQLPAYSGPVKSLEEMDAAIRKAIGGQ